MAAKVTLTESEYLRTSFPDLDREYRDGEVVERSMPDHFHSETQSRVVHFFRKEGAARNIRALAELRVRIRTGRHVIPDVAVFWPAGDLETIPERCPLVVVEVLSEDDRMSSVREKMQEYADFGIPHVWLLDPRRKEMFELRDGLREVKLLEVEELGLTVTKADVFE